MIEPISCTPSITLLTSIRSNRLTEMSWSCEVLPILGRPFFGRIGVFGWARFSKVAGSWGKIGNSEGDRY